MLASQVMGLCPFFQLFVNSPYSGILLSLVSTVNSNIIFMKKLVNVTSGHGFSCFRNGLANVVSFHRVATEERESGCFFHMSLSALIT